MMSYQKVLTFIIIISVLLFEGEVDCRRGGGGGGGRGGGRSSGGSRGRSGSVGGGGGNGSSTGGGGSTGYTFFIFLPCMAVVLTVIITCYQCVKKYKTKDKQTGRAINNHGPYVLGEYGYNTPNTPVQNNGFKVNGSKIPESKIPMQFSVENGRKEPRSNVEMHVPRVHGIKPARQHHSGQIPLKKKPDIFIL